MKTVDKTSTRTTKRGVEPEAPAKPANVGNAGGARRGPGGNEGGMYCYLLRLSGSRLLALSLQSERHIILTEK